MIERPRLCRGRLALAAAMLASMAGTSGPALAQAPDGAVPRSPGAAPALPPPAMPGASVPAPSGGRAPGVAVPAPGGSAPGDEHPHGRMPSHPGASAAGPGHEHPPGARAPRPRAGETPESRHERLMGRLDTDRDGTVSRAEFEAAQRAMNTMFERADTDHDGRLTRDEMRAWRERMATGRAARPGDAPARRAPGGAPSPGGESPRGTTG